jgi:hypothetical protein
MHNTGHSKQTYGNTWVTPVSSIPTQACVDVPAFYREKGLKLLVTNHKEPRFFFYCDILPRRYLGIFGHTNAV